MSLSRKGLINQYQISEEGLKHLLDDLCLKAEDSSNTTLVTNALKGMYSDFGSSLVTPSLTLNTHLKNAGYNDLAESVYEGRYDHNYGAKAGAAHQNVAEANKAYQDQLTGFQNSMLSVLARIQREAEQSEDPAPANNPPGGAQLK